MTQRKEHDMLGEKNILPGAYWGIHTQRAIENFMLSGRLPFIVANEVEIIALPGR